MSLSKVSNSPQFQDFFRVNRIEKERWPATLIPACLEGEDLAHCLRISKVLNRSIKSSDRSLSKIENAKETVGKRRFKRFMDLSTPLCMEVVSFLTGPDLFARGVRVNKYMRAIIHTAADTLPAPKKRRFEYQLTYHLLKYQRAILEHSLLASLRRAADRKVHNVCEDESCEYQARRRQLLACQTSKKMCLENAQSLDLADFITLQKFPLKDYFDFFQRFDEFCYHGIFMQPRVFGQDSPNSSNSEQEKKLLPLIEAIYNYLYKKMLPVYSAVGQVDVLESLKGLTQQFYLEQLLSTAQFPIGVYFYHSAEKIVTFSKLWFNCYQPLRDRFYNNSAGTIEHMTIKKDLQKEISVQFRALYKEAAARKRRENCIIS